MGEYMVGDYNYVILPRSIHPTHLTLSGIIYETRMITESFSAPQKLFWTNSHMYMYTKINNECHEIFLSLFIDCRIQNNIINVLLKI